MHRPSPPVCAPVVAAYLAELDLAPGARRTLAAGHWGVTLATAGWPLDLGLSVEAGVLRAQAEALPAGVLDPHALLYRNRRLRLVRYTHAADGTVWVEGDLPEQAVTAALVDRLLGALVAAATDVREHVRYRRGG